MRKLIEKILDKLLTTNSFQDYVNGRITRNHLNQRFCIDDISQLPSIFAVQEYHTEDIRPDDVVLDAGANIGAFSLPVSTKCKHVYAVEPLYHDVLQKNKELNRIKNITILNCGVGYNGYARINHCNREKDVVMDNMEELLRLCAFPPTFLKMDIEGYEWFLEPNDFKTFKRIEGEIHFTNGKANNGEHQVSDMLALLKDYNVDYEHHGEYAVVHAKRKE